VSLEVHGKTKEKTTFFFHGWGKCVGEQRRCAVYTCRL